ncbi:MAG: hypothetical protein KatS3mg028_1114 [Bacteroidia bacterium]|nr:MAG: hypothetical protein KatS3mg028_1114 [Bacteroidia bacterium]
MKYLKLSKKQVVYLLFGYVLIQFLWWEILLVKLHHENIEKEKQLQALKITNSEEFERIEQYYNKVQRLKIWMIGGEGTVFLILILFGFYKVLKAYERERIMNERQTHFLLSLPHEIKTPLSTIQLNLQTILQNEHLSEEQKQHLTKTSLEELKRLHLLIEQLLLTNKISKGKYVPDLQNICLSDTLKQWVHPYMQQKKIQVNIQDNLYVRTDKQLLQLMVWNLLSNALKFSEAIIEVKLYSDKQRVYLEIMNDGELIKPEEKEKIFELFYRRKSDEEKGIKGTGLGLYLVKQIADLHKIQIHVFTKNNLNVFQVVF